MPRGLHTQHVCHIAKCKNCLLPMGLNTKHQRAQSRLVPKTYGAGFSQLLVRMRRFHDS